MKDAVLVALLIVGGIAYYIYNRKLRGQKKGGSTANAMEWLSGLSSRTGQAETTVQPRRSGEGPTGQSAIEIQEQIASLLDDVYEEFMSENERTKKQFADELQQLRDDVFNRLEDIEVQLEDLSSNYVPRRAETRSDNTPKPPQTMDTTENSPNVQKDKSFQILESLYSGKTVAETAASLEVGVQEVELVRQVLQFPPSK